jgi:hypothetical protein
LPGKQHGGETTVTDIEPQENTQNNESLVGYGNLWKRQEGQGAGSDQLTYNTIPWFAIKTIFAICLLTLVFILYALHELPWSLFGSGIGLIILATTPFFAGLMLGFSFQNPRRALAFSMLVGFISLVLCFFLMMLPYLMKLADYGPGFMSDVWFYGFIIPFLLTISLVPAGAMVSVSTNVYE